MHQYAARHHRRSYEDPFDGSTKQGPELTLVPELGKPATVDIMNVYAGKSVLQGVDAPLLPSTPAARALVAAAAEPKQTTSKPDSKDKEEDGEKKKQASKEEEAKSATGRKLLQGGRAGGGSRTRGGANNLHAAMNTQAAIKRAATGRVPASYATAAGSRNARAASANCVNCLRWDNRW